MTIVIGFCFPEQAIIGADTRGMTSLDPPEFEDDHEKVYMTGFGLMSGAGEDELAGTVAYTFKYTPPATSQEVAERIRWLLQSKGYAPDEDATRLTSWLATYTTGEGDTLRAGLGYISPEANYDPLPVPENSFHVIHPYGITDEQEAEVDRMVNEALQHTILPASGQDRLNACIQTINDVVKYVSERNVTVSAQYQIGIHHVTEGAKISHLASYPAEVDFTPEAEEPFP